MVTGYEEKIKNLRLHTLHRQSFPALTGQPLCVPPYWPCACFPGAGFCLQHEMEKRFAVQMIWAACRWRSIHLGVLFVFRLESLIWCLPFFENCSEVKVKCIGELLIEVFNSWKHFCLAVDALTYHITLVSLPTPAFPQASSWVSWRNLPVALCCSFFVNSPVKRYLPAGWCTALW